jgi:hypothetical protein
VRVTLVRRLLLAVLALLLVPAPAWAEVPARLDGQVTDNAGALSGGAGSVQPALSKLQTDTGLQLWVIFVRSFDGRPAQDWTDETARLSDLGDSDALLAVATDDRAYAYSFAQDSRLTEAELTRVADDDIEPALARGDWAGAVVAAADGYRDAMSSSGGSLFWVLAVLVVVIGAALIWVLLRRRRRRAAPATPDNTEELTASANALLIELDDDLRASESELGLAAAQYGAEATATFRAALEASRKDVAEAFRLRMTLDEVPAPDAETRRRTLSEIIAKCQAADDRLDAESEAFDRLRDLEGRAAEAAEEVERRRKAAEASLPAAAKALEDVVHRWSGPAVTGISGNIDQARERLRFTADAVGQARAALATPPPQGATPAGQAEAALPGSPGGSATPAEGQAEAATSSVPGGDRAEAALAVRAAEQAVEQAEQSVAAIHRVGADLGTARTAADGLIAELQSEMATGRSITASGPAVPGGLAAAMAGAEQAVAEARAQLAVAKPDPMTAVATLQSADAALDRALAEAQDAAERAARARSVLAQALPVARAEVAAASDFINTRRGAVDSSARVSLSEAQRHLALAESLTAADPAAALTEAQQAQQLASSAGHAARADVQSWGGGGGYGQPGGFDGGAFAGAVLGGILSGGGRSRGGGFGGGGGSWGGGGFGGSASRGRRTGGGGGGGRRGGGGRF